MVNKRMCCRNLEEELGRGKWPKIPLNEITSGLNSLFSAPSLIPKSFDESLVNIRLEVELFQILKDDAVTVLHSIRQQIWKTQQRPQDWKRSLLIPIPKEGNAKECSNYHMIALISYASKVMHKIIQAKLQQYVKHELSDVQPGFRKGRRTKDQIANIHWIIE